MLCPCKLLLISVLFGVSFSVFCSRPLPFSAFHCVQDWRDRCYLDHPQQHINLSSLIAALVISAKTLSALLTGATELCLPVCVRTRVHDELLQVARILDRWSAELVILVDSILAFACVCVCVFAINHLRLWIDVLFLDFSFWFKWNSELILFSECIQSFQTLLQWSWRRRNWTADGVGVKWSASLAAGGGLCLSSLRQLSMSVLHIKSIQLQHISPRWSLGVGYSGTCFKTRLQTPRGTEIFPISSTKFTSQSSQPFPSLIGTPKQNRAISFELMDAADCHQMHHLSVCLFPASSCL